MKHPARYSDVVLPILAGMLESRERILDPFAGTGKVGELRAYGLDSGSFLVTVEIEPEWAMMEAPGVDLRLVGDATALPFDAKAFDAIVTSPTYGNRFADRHRPRNEAKTWTRRSYTYDLRAATSDPARELHPRNTGRMNWGTAYRILHWEAWREAYRVLEPRGILVLNISDHIRGGELQPVTNWHLRCLERCGFSIIGHIIDVVTPRLRYGANREARARAESVVLAWKAPRPWSVPPAELLALVDRVARQAAARELENDAIRRMTDAGREEYRAALAARDRARDALKAAWRAGFHPDGLDAFERYESGTARRKLLKGAPPLQGPIDAIDILAGVASALGAPELRRRDAYEAERTLHDLIAPWLVPTPRLEDFAVELPDALDMLQEADCLRRGNDHAEF